LLIIYTVNNLIKWIFLPFFVFIFIFVAIGSFNDNHKVSKVFFKGFLFLIVLNTLIFIALNGLTVIFSNLGFFYNLPLFVVLLAGLPIIFKVKKPLVGLTITAFKEDYALVKINNNLLSKVRLPASNFYLITQNEGKLMIIAPNICFASNFERYGHLKLLKITTGQEGTVFNLKTISNCLKVIGVKFILHIAFNDCFLLIEQNDYQLVLAVLAKEGGEINYD